MNQDLVKLDHFDGSKFTRWQDKVRFVGIMAHYWNGGYTIGMMTILLKRWLTIEKVAQLLEWWLYY